MIKRKIKKLSETPTKIQKIQKLSKTGIKNFTSKKKVQNHTQNTKKTTICSTIVMRQKNVRDFLSRAKNESRDLYIAF